LGYADALDNLGEEIADVNISTSAIEHTLNPYEQIARLGWPIFNLACLQPVD